MREISKMRIEGNEVILDKRIMASWLCDELQMLYENSKESLDRMFVTSIKIVGVLDLLGVLGFNRETSDEIYKAQMDPTDENIYRAYQAVIREFGTSEFKDYIEFRALENLGGAGHEN